MANYKWMPVFRAGTWTPKSGVPFTATINTLQEIVNKTKAKGSKLIPFVFNHPKDESISFGGFRANDVRLNNDIIEVLPSVVDNGLATLFNGGKFKGVSVKLDEDMSFVHLGFLTDNAPAVKLPSYSFEADSGLCFEFGGDEFSEYESEGERLARQYNEKTGRAPKRDSFDEFSSDGELSEVMQLVRELNRRNGRQ